MGGTPIGQLMARRFGRAAAILAGLTMAAAALAATPAASYGAVITAGNDTGSDASGVDTPYATFRSGHSGDDVNLDLLQFGMRGQPRPDLAAAGLGSVAQARSHAPVPEALVSATTRAHPHRMSAHRNGRHGERGGRSGFHL